MEVATILALINGATQLARGLAPLVEQGLSVLHSDDQAQITAALAALQAANEPLYERAQAKLRG
ncbi:hypothetical protein [Phenylobacterium sp.]|jgi:hypothetical protein|uniref:hypothetical protein n=1 Tax=Phenylobacterium sp. TaxID=1871053 RepID=UPI002F3E877A